MDSSLMIQKSFTLAGFQFSFRILTFLINLVLVRFLPKAILGLVNVRLILLYSTIVFIAREPFRKVCLGLNLNVNTKQLINLMWLIVPFSIVISVVLVVVWCELLPFPVGYDEYKYVAIFYGLSAIIELSSEPIWLVSQINLMVKFRAIVEACALFLRIVVSTALFFHWPHFGLYAFGIAQLVYGVFISASYFLYFRYVLVFRRRTEELPGIVLAQSTSIVQYRDLFPDIFAFHIDTDRYRMIKGFVWNSVLKQLLTEGERYVMTASGWVSLEMQGDFDVICGLGSLAPRLIFSAVEDSCHLAFSRLLRHSGTARLLHQDTAKASFEMLTTSLRIVGVLGLTIVVFAQAYSWPLLILYAGWDRAIAGAGLLRVFALYVLILAVNGVTECFYYSAINQEELDHHTYRLIEFSIVFITSGSVLVWLYGPVGVIWANCINMLLRISISTRFISRFYEGSAYTLGRVLTASVPHATVLIAYLLSLVAIMVSMICCHSSLGGQLIHVSIGAVFLALDFAVILYRERAFTQFLAQKLKRKTS